MTIQELKKQVVEIAQESYRSGLVAATSGNYSIFDPSGRLIAITPSGVPYSTMTTEDIVIITLAGEVAEGKFAPSSEWPMHAVIYKKLPQIRAVVHTHSPYATAFAVLGEAIPVVLIEMIPSLGGDVPVAQFALPGTTKVGDNAVQMLQDRSACLLANHGVVAVGQNLFEAYNRAVYVEDAAKIYHHAKAVGSPKVIPAEIVEEMRAATYK